MHRMRVAARPGPSAPYRAASRAPVFRRGVQELFEVGAKPAEWNQAGRAWKAEELRLKSFDDLHKLWYVMLKEKNLLLSQREMMDENGQKAFKRKNSRLWKVKKSMARLLTVLSERKNMYEEYKGSLKRASKTPDAKLPSIESLQGKGDAKPAADAKAAPAAAADAKPAAAADGKPADPSAPQPKRVYPGAEGVAKLVAAAGVRGGPVGSKKRPAMPKKAAAKGSAAKAAAAAGGAAPEAVQAKGEEEEAPAKPKKEKVKRDWKELRAKLKEAKAAGGTAATPDAAAAAAPAGDAAAPPAAGGEAPAAPAAPTAGQQAEQK